jgi:hypothetical protein
MKPPREVKREMNDFERSTIRWARVAVLLSGAAALFICLQWYEMHTGGADTHDLAVAAGKQADAAKALADQAKAQTEKMDKLIKEATAQATATGQQARASMAASLTQQKQLEVTDRARIRVEITGNRDIPPNALFPGALIFDADGRGNLGRTIILHNVGRSIATEVRIRNDTLVTDPNDPAAISLPINRQKEFCATRSDANIKNKLPPPSYTVFPEYPTKFHEASTFETKSIPDAPADRSLKNGKPVGLFVIGCVDYRYGSSAQNHQTGFIFEVYGDTKHQAIQIKMTIPADNLTFEPFFLGGEYAY